MKIIQTIKGENHAEIYPLSRFQLYWRKNKKKQNKRRRENREKNKELINKRRRDKYSRLDLEAVNRERREKEKQVKEKEKKRELKKLCDNCKLQLRGQRIRKDKIIDRDLDSNNDDHGELKPQKNKRPLRKLPTAELLEKV